MGRFVDLTGQKFGRLTVIKRAKNIKGGRIRWLCQCVCNEYIIVIGNNLQRNHTRSCGCLWRDSITKHNLCDSRTYHTWENMIQRCTNFNCKNYENYGGRGIKVCKKWWKFEGFLQDMGERPPGLTLDRIDNDGDYCKENCRWATYAIQRRNRNDIRWITINNKTMCLKDWCNVRKLNYKTIIKRLSLGWPISKVLELKKHEDINVVE